ncbi:peptide/nickel transport system substrate-binding protein [Propionibacteriaceae bacterium ES.041]|uniref:ABC transporter substrate-binding protein n=1 Tax=Enemella evansiae TaxID=2016499 RepID=UPI000B961E7C|nr:ABC transporter substrate-binding protein [Enemella evansiae]OYO01013.1 peptide ABC transporter substrate-binding protein [Enemella evansiae]PFG68240.1 peptide/nickel transport system substrate-binding protein [Propionibacteriaceae bacterium ES.041]
MSSRRTSSWSRLLAALGVLLVALLPWVGTPTARAADAPVLKVAVTADIDNFNPFKTVLLTSTQINRMQYEPLVQWGPDNKLTEGLANKWEASPDAKTWTFTIPAGRSWSDGQPITAEDAAWTFQQMQQKEELQTANGSLVENVTSVEAKDPQTVVITMKEPQASNPGNELPIVPKHIWEKLDAAKTNNDLSDGQPIVGSGPFLMTKYVKGQSIELTANPKFFRGAPKIGGITFVYYKNLDAAVQGLRAGEIDLVNGLTPAQFNSLKNQQGITANNGEGRRYQGLAINPGAVDAAGKPLGDGNPALQNPQVREAILTAIDKKVLLERVLGGLGKPGITQEPTVYPDYFGLAAGASERTFDPAKANQLLDQAGYRRGADGVRVDPSGKPLKLRLMGRSSDATHAQLADFVKQWLSDVGIPVETSMVSNTQVNNDSTLGKYDLYFTGWSIGPDPDYQLSINLCSSRPNADGSGATSENNWCDPKFDQLYAQQHSELDPAKRADLVKQAWTVAYQANVIDIVYYADYLEAYRSDRFANFTTQPENTGTITNQNGYWGYYGATPVQAGDTQAQTAGGGSSNTGLWIGIGVVAVLALAGGFFAMRRRKPAEDRE